MFYHLNLSILINKYSLKKSFLLLALCILLKQVTNAQLTKFQYSTEKMGSPFNLVFAASDKATADEISKQCFKLVDSLVHIFSDYDSSSELNWINQHAGIAPVIISSQMLNLLLISKQAYYKSEGAYTIAIGPLSSIWRNARKGKQFPHSNEVQIAKQLSDFTLIEIDSSKSRIYLPQKGMRLDVGGLGKGYIAQLVLNFLKANGIHQALVDAGGKIVMSEAIEPNKNWKIGINLSQSKTHILDKNLMLNNCAVATSGDIYQFMYHEGKKYSHIINPQTGYGLNNTRNVTVIAKDGAEADWLATACSILPIQQALKLVNSYHGNILIAVQNKGRIKYYKSKGFNQLLK